MMKILYVVPYTPNQIRVRPYSLLRELNRQGHSVVLATLWSSADEKATLVRLQQEGIEVIAQPLPTWRSMLNMLRTLPTHKPLQSAYCWHPLLAEQIVDSVRSAQFDVVHVEHLRGAVYGLHVNKQRTQAESPVPIVWDSVDCISHLFAQAAQTSRSLKGRLMTSLDLKRTQAYEAWLVDQFDQVLVTSRHDRDALLALAKPTAAAKMNDEHIRVLPNGVDLDYFAPGVDPREETTVVFSGKMSYHANITAALYLLQEVMPIVWAEQPDVNVNLVGKDPTPAVRALARPAGKENGEVVVTGTVPDLRVYLQRAAIAVTPIAYGAGIQNKVLEALACATPVVSTPQAVSALGLSEDEGVLVGGDAQEIADAILALLADKQRRARLGADGRDYVERRHNWSNIVAELAGIYVASQSRRTVVPA